MEKRGISPVIATILLISIMLVVAIVVFAAFRGLLKEKAQKFEQPVEYACDDVVFDAEAILGEINIVNRGNVPIYAIDIMERGESYGLKLGRSSTTILNGETESFEIPEDVSAGAELVIVPVILGEVGTDTKAYTCEEKYGVEVIVL